MKFQSISADGFGCLVNAEFSLAPGLNIFFGPNEVGKSTLQQAIFALLYGFYKGNRKTNPETECWQRFKPWYASAYAGQVVYQLDDGKAYRVTRDFDEELTTHIAEADTGRDVSNEFERGRLGRLDFARRHFGMSQEVFINTCFVRQADLHHLDEVAATITETIVNLADTGSRDRSVMRAQQTLEKALREQVGTERARSKPLPAARERLDELLAEKTAVEDQRLRLEGDYELRSRYRQDLETYEREAEQLKYLLAKARWEGLNRHIEEIEKIQKEASELNQRIIELDAVANFPMETREVVTRLSQDRLTKAERLNRLEAAAAQALAEVSSLRNQATSLKEQMRRLEPSRSIPIEHEEELRALERVWRERTNAYQQARHSQQQVDQAITAALPVRADAQKHAILLQVGPEKIHDMRLEWETARRQLEAAEGQLAKAAYAWRTQNMSAEEFRALANGMEGLSADVVADLKRRQLSAAASVKEASKSSSKWVIGSLGCGGAGTGILGLALATIGGLTANMIPMLAGLILLGIALTLAVIGVYLWRSTKNLVTLPLPPPEDLRQKGFASVQDIETAFMRYLQARPLQTQWQEAETRRNQAQEQVNVIAAKLQPLLDSLGVSAEQALQAEQTAKQIAQDLARLEGLEQERTRREQETHAEFNTLETAEQQLRTTLAGAGLAGPNLDVDLRSFFALCDNRRQLERLEANLGEMDAKIEGKLTAENELKLARLELATTEKGLGHVLKQAGIEAGNLETALQKFDHRVEQAETRERIQKALVGIAREEKALLQSDTLEQLKSQRAALQQYIQTVLAANPNLKSISSTRAENDLQADLAAIQRKTTTAEKELVAMETRLQTEEANQRSLAEVEEEILSMRELIGRLSFHGQALGLAMQHLAAAADAHHRNFLPKLNQAVGKSLEFITGGRYHQVQIDHADLQVRVQVPGRTEPVTPDLLSRGAQEQIYLLLRVGLTEMMSNRRECLPLVLDDPLVNYDHERLLHALDFLAQLTETTQILLFTKDEQTVNWFQQKHLDKECHRLHLLQPAM